ncbi:TetR/AcrR family transcriptional regulator [Nonomuraea longicatena]|uniref:TetR/AcrR family transcriptional regulator n=1 Tax=Nonomuraea longicatena TaxID=83682 RepID=A0ABP4AZ80_9ACTN
MLGQAPPERADAARNRQKIIECAERMLAECGGHQLSLDEVARVAGVGVGTVYRRFGDRAGLLFALVEDSERRFQESFMTGPPPLGPGTGPSSSLSPGAGAEVDPQARVAAFMHALLDHQAGLEKLLLLLEKSSPDARFSGPYPLYHTHLATLLAKARPGADPHFLADALLSSAAVTLVTFLRTRRALTLDQIKSRFTDLVLSICAGPPLPAEEPTAQPPR